MISIQFVYEDKNQIEQQKNIQQSGKMAFFSQSPKYPPIYKSTIEKIGRVGPGSYHPSQKENPKVNGFQSVFNSKNQRIYAQNSSSHKIGPGTYNIQNAHKNFLIKKHTHGCKSSFESKIERFKKLEPKQVKEPQSPNIYEFLLERNSSKKKLGKLHGIQRQNKNTSEPISIPSIPSAQQSYGYRIDTKTKKLVVNDNPNVLLARKTYMNSLDAKILMSTNGSYNGPGSNMSVEKRRIKGMRWGKQKQKQKECQEKKRESEKQEQKLKEQISIMEIDRKKWESKGNPIISKENRFKNKRSINQQLYMKKLERDYGQYVGEDGKEFRLILKEKGRKQKENKQSQNRNKNKRSKQDVNRNLIECFDSKQLRFSNDKHHDIIKTQSSAPKQERIQVNPDKPKPVNTSFGSKSPRFPASNKYINRNIGPGSYSIQHRSFNNNICNQQQKNRSRLL